MTLGDWRKFKAARKSTVFVAVLSIVAATCVGVATFGVRAAPSTDVERVAFDAGGPPVVRTESARSVLFIGDSYTMGPGSMPDYGYPCVAATNLGWQCNLGVQPATGYISGGEGHRLPKVLGALDETSTSLSERFPRLRQLHRADIVVLDAGRNDFQFGPIYLRNLFVVTLRRAIESWPNSRIVVIAPWFATEPIVEVPDGGGITYGRYLEETLRSFPEFNAVTFIDPGSLGWFVGMDIAPFMADDGIHPNIAGNKLIGDLLTTELIRNGFADTA